jgi:methylated-DNA-[protein]-cysteine S-methyltransferase
MRRATSAAGNSFLLQHTPVGMLGIVAGERGLVEILLHPMPVLIMQQISERHPQAKEGHCTLLQQAGEQLTAYFRQECRSFDLPIDFSGLSPFTLRVLETLQGIPFGATTSYGDLALLAGSPGAARAVGGVMAANPFPLVIPCHRVLGSGGRLGGYSGGEGLVTKEWLLEFERKAISGDS